MEEKFLKARQGREEQRQQRLKEGEESAALRLQYEEEFEKLVAEVRQNADISDVVTAQQQLDTLRGLVQDTANSITLTAHDMAKANTMLAELQQHVDAQASTATGPKKFKFSTRLKAKPAVAAPSVPSYPPPTASAGVPNTVAECVPASTTTSSSAALLTTSSSNGGGAGAGNSYGPFSGVDVFIGGAKGAFVRDCVDCTLYCLPVAGSVFFSHCTNCRVYVSCHQLRLKDCVNSDFYVWCGSTPIIESCDGIRFGPYMCWAGLLQSRMESDPAYFDTHAKWVEQVGEMAATAHTETNYERVEDFQWVRKTASPHWRVLTEQEHCVSDTVFAVATPPSRAA